MRRTLTTALTTSVLGGAAALLAGCGGPVPAGAPAQPIQSTQAVSGSTSSSAPATSQEGSATPDGPPKCTAADVRGSFEPGDSIGPGIALRSIAITNSGSRTCTVHGYGGLEMHTGGDGAAMTFTLTRETSPAPGTLTLRPGGRAYKKLTWRVPRTDDEKQGCQQGAAYAFVTLPDDTKTFEVHPADGSDDLGDICDAINGYAWSSTDPATTG